MLALPESPSVSPTWTVCSGTQPHWLARHADIERLDLRDRKETYRCAPFAFLSCACPAHLLQPFSPRRVPMQAHAPAVKELMPGARTHRQTWAPWRGMPAHTAGSHNLPGHGREHLFCWHLSTRSTQVRPPVRLFPSRAGLFSSLYRRICCMHTPAVQRACRSCRSARQHVDTSSALSHCRRRHSWRAYLADQRQQQQRGTDHNMVRALFATQGSWVRHRHL